MLVWERKSITFPLKFSYAKIHSQYFIKNVCSRKYKFIYDAICDFILFLILLDISCTFLCYHLSFMWWCVLCHGICNNFTLLININFFSACISFFKATPFLAHFTKSVKYVFVIETHTAEKKILARLAGNVKF